MLGIQKFEIFFEISFTKLKEVHAVVILPEGGAMIGAICTPFTLSTELPIIDLIWLFLHAWYVTSYIVLNCAVTLTDV